MFAIKSLTDEEHLSHELSPQSKYTETVSEEVSSLKTSASLLSSLLSFLIPLFVGGIAYRFISLGRRSSSDPKLISLASVKNPLKDSLKTSLRASPESRTSSSSLPKISDSSESASAATSASPQVLPDFQEKWKRIIGSENFLSKTGDPLKERHDKILFPSLEKHEKFFRDIFSAFSNLSSDLYEKVELRIDLADLKKFSRKRRYIETSKMTYGFRYKEEDKQLSIRLIPKQKTEFSSFQSLEEIGPQKNLSNSAEDILKTLNRDAQTLKNLLSLERSPKEVYISFFFKNSASIIETKERILTAKNSYEIFPCEKGDFDIKITALESSEISQKQS